MKHEKHLGCREPNDAQALTSLLLSEAGIRPGMTALTLASGSGDVAFLVAERVGPGGRVIGIDADPQAVERARQLAKRQCFAHVFFETMELGDVPLEETFDLVIGQSALLRRPDPVEVIRRAATLLRPGGRLVFQEWHVESTTWPHTGAVPYDAAHQRFAESLVHALRRAGARTDMGLQLTGAFVEAGLPAPAVHLELRMLTCSFDDARAQITQMMSALVPALDRSAKRVARDVAAAHSHVYLPLQVGAWVRKPDQVR